MWLFFERKKHLAKISTFGAKIHIYRKITKKLGNFENHEKKYGRRFWRENSNGRNLDTEKNSIIGAKIRTNKKEIQGKKVAKIHIGSVITRFRHGK